MPLKKKLIMHPEIPHTMELGFSHYFNVGDNIDGEIEYDSKRRPKRLVADYGTTQLSIYGDADKPYFTITDMEAKLYVGPSPESELTRAEYDVNVSRIKGSKKALARAARLLETVGAEFLDKFGVGEISGETSDRFAKALAKRFDAEIKRVDVGRSKVKVRFRKRDEA